MLKTNSLYHERPIVWQLGVLTVLHSSLSTVMLQLTFLLLFWELGFSSFSLDERLSRDRWCLWRTAGEQATWPSSEVKETSRQREAAGDILTRTTVMISSLSDCDCLPSGRVSPYIPLPNTGINLAIPTKPQTLVSLTAYVHILTNYLAGELQI